MLARHLQNVFTPPPVFPFQYTAFVLISLCPPAPFSWLLGARVRGPYAPVTGVGVLLEPPALDPSTLCRAALTHLCPPLQPSRESIPVLLQPSGHVDITQPLSTQTRHYSSEKKSMTIIVLSIHNCRR